MSSQVRLGRMRAMLRRDRVPVRMLRKQSKVEQAVELRSQVKAIIKANPLDQSADTYNFYPSNLIANLHRIVFSSTVAHFI